MKRYKTRTVEQQHFVGLTCDGCGKDGSYLSIATVVIKVEEDEEGGSVDEYHYCDDCLAARADVLVAAGSRAPLVTGNWPERES